MISIIKLENLNFNYKDKKIFENLNIEIPNNKLSVLLGPNGAGKTTLLKIITGNIKADGKISTTFKKIFYLPQSIYYPKKITTFDYVSSVFYKNNWKWFLSDNEKNRVEETLRLLELLDKKNIEIQNLSGGEIQKANLALGLLTEADIFILDEPASNMDIINTIKMLKLLKGLLSKNITTLIIMHDINLAAEYGDYFIGLGQDNVIKAEKQDFFSKDNLEKIYGINFEIFENNNKLYIQAIG